MSAKSRILESRHSSKILTEMYVVDESFFLFIYLKKNLHEEECSSGDMLACGLENGAIWILHYITLDPLDEIPYKHSPVAVNRIVFTPDAEYMAYSVRKLDAFGVYFTSSIII